MDGFEFLKQLRSNKYIKHNDIPVLLLSSGAEERKVHDAIHLGIHGYLLKPMSKTTSGITSLRQQIRPYRSQNHEQEVKRIGARSGRSGYFSNAQALPSTKVRHI